MLCAGAECKMVDWRAKLSQQDGLTAAEKGTIRGRLLLLPPADRTLWFGGDPAELLAALRTLLPDTSGHSLQNESLPMFN